MPNAAELSSRGSPAGDIASAIELRDAAGYLRLPFRVMRDAGPAAVTFGAILDRIDRRTGETFTAVAKIAETAGLPVKTARLHVPKLIRRGWVQSDGRRGRRTATLRVLDRGGPYAPFPRWWKNQGPPVAGLVYAVVLNRWTMLEDALESDCYGKTFDDDAGPEHLAELSLSDLQAITGAARSTIAASLGWLERERFIRRRPASPTAKQVVELLPPPCPTRPVSDA